MEPYQYGLQQMPGPAAAQPAQREVVVAGLPAPPQQAEDQRIAPPESLRTLQAPPADAEALAKLQKQFISGANWFYWIAGLSVVNSIIALMESDVRFVIGLGITQIIGVLGEVLAEQIGTTARYVAFALEILAAAVFALFGYFARKRHLCAFVTGIVLYVLDALIFLLAIQDWWSFGFHVFASIGLCTGLSATLKLRKTFQPRPEGQAPAAQPPTAGEPGANGGAEQDQTVG